MKYDKEMKIEEFKMEMEKLKLEQKKKDVELAQLALIAEQN